MPVKPLELDDRTFTDLFEEVRSLIPRYAPGWTDHNVSDPGITVLELFAWVTEAMLYRINRVPDASRVRLLELLGATFQPARPAILNLRVRASEWPNSDSCYFLERGAQVWGHSAARGSVPFEVMRKVQFTTQESVRSVTLRQTQPITARALARPDVGRPFELVPVGEGYLVLPPEPRPRRPQVTVNDEPWRLVNALRNASTEGRRVALKPWLNAVAFGGGQETVDGQAKETGNIPPVGAKIRVTYRSSPSPRAVVTDTFTSTGQPWQVHRLSRPLLLLDMQEPDDLEPLLEAQEIKDGPRAHWEYVTSFLDMAAEAAQYSLDPWTNSIRCGGGRYGGTPTSAARLRLSGRVTLGAGGNLPHDTEFAGWIMAGADPQQQPKMSVESWEFLSPGSNPTVLDEARLQVLAMLRPDWRAVTADDFRSVIRSNLPDIARVVCLPGRLPSDGENQERPGYVGLIVIPDRATELTAPSHDLCSILSSAPDSRRLVAAAHDGAISLWNMDTSEPSTPLEAAGVRTGAFSPNGKTIATASVDLTARIWDAATGQELHQLTGHTGPVSSAAFSPDGKRIVTASWDRTARIWDAATGQELRQLTGHTGTVSSAVFSPDGKSIVTAGHDGTARIWDAATGQELRRLTGHTGQVSSAAFSPDGERIVTTGHDGTARIWDAATGQELRQLAGHAGTVSSAVFSPDGESIVTADHDRTARIWDAATGQELHQLIGHTGPVSSAAFSPDGKRLLTASWDQTARMWDAETRQELRQLTGHTSYVYDAAFSPDGKRIVTASMDSTARIWDTATGQELHRLIGHAGPVSSAVFSPDGRRLMTYAPNPFAGLGAAMLWDVSTTDLVTHLGRVSQLPRFSPRGRWLVTIQGDGAWLRDIDDGVGVHWLPGVTSWDHLAFGPGDVSLVAASGGAVQLWDMTGEGKYQELLPPAPAGATSFTMVALSADGSCAAATDAGGHVHVWQLRAKPVETVDMLLVSESPARSLLLNPTGTRFITRSDDGIAALWSARTGARLANLSAGSPVTLLALSGDGRWLATAHADQKVRVWHAADGAELRELPHGAPVCALVFSPEGRRLAAITAAAGKYVLHAWSLRPEATQAVTTRELDGRNPPIVHTSGRWLAYGDERLMHIWDVETGADLTAIYVDFADPDVILDSWKLEPVDARLPTSCGIQAATGAPVPLTQSKYLRIVSAAAPSENAKRSVQHWNAEHVHEAGALLATRRLVTTRSVVAGPTYTDVTVDVSVVRYLPTISLEQLKGDIRHALLRFFDPLHGGPDKTGWPPGRAIYSSEVCQVVEAIKGVDHVECVLLGADQSENTEQLGIPPHSLVRATVITQVR